MFSLTAIINSGSMLSAFWNIISGFVSIIPKTLYLLYMSLVGVVDFLQLLIRKLAGLDTYYVNGTEKTGDIIYDFFIGIFTGEYPILQTAFYSLLILGFILLILSTIIAIIKSEFNMTDEDKKGEKTTGNSKGKILKFFWRAIFMMFVVPLTCVFGVYIGNIVLKAVDLATSQAVVDGTLANAKIENGENAFAKNSAGTFYNYNVFGFMISSSQPTFSAMIYRIFMFEANRVRLDDNFYEEVILVDNSEVGKTTNFDIFNQLGNEDDCAALIDECFANSIKLSESAAGKQLDFDGYAESINVSVNIFDNDRYFAVDSFNRYRVSLVWYFYDMWYANFIVGIAVLYFIIRILADIIFGLAGRLVKLIALFMVYAPFVGLLPITQGGDKEPFKAWKGAFVKNAVSAYGAIGGINVMMLILPYINKIHFFPDTTWFLLLNNLISCLFTITALTLVKDFIKMLSEFMNSSNVADEGSALAQTSGELAQKSASFLARPMQYAGSRLTRRLAEDGAERLKTRHSSDLSSLDAEERNADALRESQLARANREAEVNAIDAGNAEAESAAFDKWNETNPGKTMEDFQATGRTYENMVKKVKKDKMLDDEYDKYAERTGIGHLSKDKWLKSSEGKEKSKDLNRETDQKYTEYMKSKAYDEGTIYGALNVGRRDEIQRRSDESLRNIRERKTDINAKYNRDSDKYAVKIAKGKYLSKDAKISKLPSDLLLGGVKYTDPFTKSRSERVKALGDIEKDVLKSREDERRGSE